MLGHGLHPHTRARRTEPGRTGCCGACPRPAVTNAVRFRGLLDLLHFVGFYFLFKNSVEIFRVELDPFKRIGSARCNHSHMITDSLGLLQTERSAEGYKYPISARIIYKKQKSIYPLSPTQISYRYSDKNNCVLAISFLVFSRRCFPLKGNKPPSEQRPDSSS